MALQDRAIQYMIAVVVVGLVAIPVVQNSLVTDTEDVVNDTFTSSGTLPEQFTLTNVEEGIVEDSETVTFKNTTGDGSTLDLEASDYTLNLNTGELNISSVTGATPDSGDEYLVDYTYKPTGYIESAPSRLMVENITLFMALGLFIAVFSMVLRR